MWFSNRVLRPRFVGGSAARDRPAQPADYVRQPEHRSLRTRSAAAASFAGCIIEDSYYRQSGGAKSGGSPDKAGADYEVSISTD